MKLLSQNFRQFALLGRLDAGVDDWSTSSMRRSLLVSMGLTRMLPSVPDCWPRTLDAPANVVPATARRSPRERAVRSLATEHYRRLIRAIPMGDDGTLRRHRCWSLEASMMARQPVRMRWLKRGSEPGVLPSEKGLFELAGRTAGLPLRDVVVHFRDLVSADMDWADSRKTRFRRSASRIKLGSLILAALSTVVLGIEAIPGRSWVALPLVAAVTVLGGLESFFNWRSRWVLMEEAQYRFNRLRDEIDYYLTVTPPDAVTRDVVDRFFADQQLIWSDVSRRWIEFRSLGASQSRAGSDAQS